MFVKLFGSILDSSIWAEDHATVRVWITMLAMADRDGVVRAAPIGLAGRAHVSVPELRKALELFQKPDLESRSQEYGGRRIEQVDGGWLLLNHKKYREIQTAAQQRHAEAQGRYRKIHKDAPKEVSTASPVTGVIARDADPVSVSASASVPASASTEGEAEAERVHTREGPEGQRTRSPLLDALAHQMAEHDPRAAEYLRTGTQG